MVLERHARAEKLPFRMCSGRGSSCTPPRGCRTSISPPGWIARRGWSAVAKTGSRAERLDGLEDKRASGRPRRFPPGTGRRGQSGRVRAAARYELPLSRFSRVELHRLVIERGVTEASASTIWRWLHEDAIKPWQQRCWILPTRSRVRREGRQRAGSLRPRVRGQAPASRRVRDLSR